MFAFERLGAAMCRSHRYRRAEYRVLNLVIFFKIIVHLTRAGGSAWNIRSNPIEVVRHRHGLAVAN